jgi:putative ABC transport system permease protein
MFRATVKGLLARKFRLALSALSIALGIAFVSGTLVLTDTMERTFTTLFRDIIGSADLIVQPSSFAEFGRPIPAELVGDIEAVPGVREAAGAATGYARVLGPDGEPVGGRGPSIGTSWIDDDVLNPFRIDVGGPPDRPSEVVIDNSTAESMDVGIGDWIVVLFEGPPRTLQVSGIADMGLLGQFGNSSLVALNADVAQEAFRTQGGFTSISVTVDGGADAVRVRDAVAQLLPEGFRVQTGLDVAREFSDRVKQGLGFFRAILFVFAGASLIVGAFLVLNTFSITISQRRREIALFRTLGATRRQVVRAIVAEAAIVGAIAAAVGVVLGYIGAAALPHILRAFGIGFPVVRTTFLVRTAAIGLGIGTLLAVLAALVPARRAGRTAPLEALRDSALPAPPARARRWALAGFLIAAGGVVVVAIGLTGAQSTSLTAAGCALALVGVAFGAPAASLRLATWLGRPLARAGLAGRLARDNARRNPTRIAASAGALTMGLTLVSLAAVAATSLKATTVDIVENTVSADLVVTTTDFSGFDPEVAGRLEERPETGVVVPARFGPVSIEAEQRTLTATDPADVDQVLEPNLVTGSLNDLQMDKVFVSHAEATDRGWEIGDTLAAEFPLRSTRLEIVGTFDNDLVVGGLVVSLETYDESYPKTVDSMLLLSGAPGVNKSELRTAVDQAMEPWPTARVLDQNQLKKRYGAEVDRLLMIVYALLGLAVLIALAGITNTLALSVLERTRELGLLRAVGMTRRQVRSAVRWEAVLVALIGAISGVVIGSLCAWAVVSSLEDIRRVAYPASHLTAFVVLSAAAAVVASIPAARRASNVDVLTAVTIE